jgi:hypothetical protein
MLPHIFQVLEIEPLQQCKSIINCDLSSNNIQITYALLFANNSITSDIFSIDSIRKI